MAIVKKVLSHSVLHGKISVGDEVLYFDDRAFSDILDYIFADSKQSGSLSIKHKGAEKVIYYEKENDYDTLGLEFDDSIEIKPIECHNNCIFCFVRQLPKGMRDTLYVKDDDYRLSFISGSYITCTNLQEKDMQRILDYKLSPLYVSVHATDENVRKFLLGIKKCPDQMQQLNRLIGGGITRIRRGKGCRACNNTGYKGRVSIHEIVSVDKTLKRMIAKNADADEMEEYVRREQGMKTLFQSAVELVAKGVTTPDEVLRVAYYSD